MKKTRGGNGQKRNKDDLLTGTFTISLLSVVIVIQKKCLYSVIFSFYEVVTLNRDQWIFLYHAAGTLINFWQIKVATILGFRASFPSIQTTKDNRRTWILQCSTLNFSVFQLQLDRHVNSPYQILYICFKISSENLKVDQDNGYWLMTCPTDSYHLAAR